MTQTLSSFPRALSPPQCEVIPFPLPRARSPGAAGVGEYGRSSKSRLVTFSFLVSPGTMRYHATSSSLVAWLFVLISGCWGKSDPLPFLPHGVCALGQGLGEGCSGPAGPCLAVRVSGQTIPSVASVAAALPGLKIPASLRGKRRSLSRSELPGQEASVPPTVLVGCRAWPQFSSVSQLSCEHPPRDALCVCGARLWGVQAMGHAQGAQSLAGEEDTARIYRIDYR